MLKLLHRVAPGRLGLNTQQSAEELTTDWCITASNAILDSTGRIAARKGTKRQHSTSVGASTPVKSIWEYKDSSSNVIEIFAAGNKIYKLDTSAGTTTDITGTITTPTDDNWKFQNFNGKCIGFQAGHAPIVLASVAGTFADIVLSGTNQPTTAAVDVLSSFGYLFVLDGTNLLISDALDETSWNTVYDLKTVWTKGMDTAVTVQTFNGYLFIFGQISTIVYANASTPSTLIKSDILDEGCIARDSVAFTGTDLIFLSKSGVHSLGRLLIQKSSPLSLLSGNVKDTLVYYANTATAANIKAGYDTYNDQYILAFPDSTLVYVFNLVPSGNPVVTTWTRLIYSIHETFGQKLHFGTGDGYVVNNQDYLDDVNVDGTGGSTYYWEVKFGYTSFANELQVAALQHRRKILKDYSVLLTHPAGGPVTLAWSYDFTGNYTSSAVTATAITQAEYGVAEYNVDEYSSTPTPEPLAGSPSDEGNVVSFSVSAYVNGYTVACQALTSRFKYGRMSI